MNDASTFRYVSKHRRTQEDRRFVSGSARYVADVVAADVLHVALVPSQEAAARIISIDTAAARAVLGVHDVIVGAELAAAVEPMAAAGDPAVVGIEEEDVVELDVGS